MEDGLRIYRGQLPHWRAPDATYFVTWRLHRGQPPLTHSERAVVADALGHFDGDQYRLLAFVVMDDHVHLVIEPFAGRRLEDILQSRKSFTAHCLQRQSGRHGSVWQPESYDRIIRKKRELLEKMRYVAGNPYRRWPELDSYPHMGTLLEE